MSEKTEPKITSSSNASSLEEVAGFWDTHSLADDEAQTPEVEFEVRATRKRKGLLALEAPDLTKEIQAERLVNL